MSNVAGERTRYNDFFMLSIARSAQPAGLAALVLPVSPSSFRFDEPAKNTYSQRRASYLLCSRVPLDA